MKNPFAMFSVKPPSNQFFDLILQLLDEENLSDIQKVVSDHRYISGNAIISIKYFDPDAFEEVQISLGYAVGTGVTIVLRNYAEHLVVINHEILGQFHTIEFPIPTDSFALKGYRDKLDKIAESLVKSIEEIDNA